METSHSTRQRLDGKLFGWWVFASTVGWIAGLWVPSLIRRPALGATLNTALLGLLGPIMGVAQWLVLRKHIRKAIWWILATTVGGYAGLTVAISPLSYAAVGLLVIVWCQCLPDRDVLYRIYTLLGVGLLLPGFLIGVAQWLVLRRQIRRAGLWVGASTIAWAGAIVSFGAVALLLSSFGGTDFIYLFTPGLCVMSYIIGAAPGVLVGVITGATLAWLSLPQRPSSRVDKWCLLRQVFWTQLLERVEQGAFRHTLSTLQNYLRAAASRSGFFYNYVIRQDDALVELQIAWSDVAENKRFFETLFDHREEIERAFGDRLTWLFLEGPRVGKIRYRIHGGGLRDQDRWPEIQDQMIDAMIRMEHALAPKIESL